MTWEEVQDGVADASALTITPDAVLRRVARDGDLLAPLLDVAAGLPRWALDHPP